MRRPADVRNLSSLCLHRAPACRRFGLSVRFFTFPLDTLENCRVPQYCTPFLRTLLHFLALTKSSALFLSNISPLFAQKHPGLRTPSLPFGEAPPHPRQTHPIPPQP